MEIFALLEVPVLEFHEVDKRMPDVFRCSGNNHFRNWVPSNDRVQIHAVEVHE